MLKKFDTPILLLVFNRLESTEKVLKEIRKIKPKRLYVSCDGPRLNNEIDVNNVTAVRVFIESFVDWDCELLTNYYDCNLGCKVAVSSGLDWFFSQVECGIVLEDDCVPSLSFFNFCEIMLNKYENDFRIWHIGGVCNLNSNDFIEDSSYYFSNYAHIWGWATWSNRWKFYNRDIKNLHLFKRFKFLKTLTHSIYSRELWTYSFNSSRLGMVDTWDYQWYYTIWSNGGLTILPKINLISNIGFGSASTHTKSSNHFLSNRDRYELNQSEFIEPDFMRVIPKYDKKNEKLLFFHNYYSLLKTFIYFIFKKIYNDKRN